MILAPVYRQSSLCKISTMCRIECICQNISPFRIACAFTIVSIAAVAFN